jgi:16S rRNA (guanine1207-N2)-methyltransferase
MADHYFTEVPNSQHKPMRFQAEYRGHVLNFQTDSGVFSRTEIDKGTQVLLNALPDHITGDVLDLGCGYGALGVCLKKHNPDCRLMMADINTRAVSLAAENAASNKVDAEVLQSDGFEALPFRRFDLIVTNPPIRTGKQVIYKLFTDAAATLKEHGVLMLVIRKKQGAPSAFTALGNLFQTVNIIEKKSGYWVIRCTDSFADNS